MESRSCLAVVVVARCRGVEGARVDPVSAWDALCAVQSEEVDVLTGMTLLPAGEPQTAGACHSCMGDTYASCSYMAPYLGGRRSL